MMSPTADCISWLRGLSDDYIVNWSNKGRFRRAGRLVNSEAPSAWDLDTLSSKLEGFSQTLTSGSLKDIRCDCPAVDLCHHVVALVLGLRRAALEVEIRDDGKHANLEPWILETRAARIRAVGKPHYDRAMTLFHRGVQTELTENDHALIGQVLLDHAFEVHIPRVGDMDTWVCTCKQQRCVHRALVVIQACANAGLAIGESTSTAAAPAPDLIDKTRHWLRELAVQGLNGLSRRVLDQGAAIATELAQADLPGIAGALRAANAELDREWRRSSVTSVQLRDAVATLWAQTTSLKSTPSATIVGTIGGFRRELYTVVKGLRLHTLGFELWESARGYRGYSVHFFAPDSGRGFALSEARASGQDPSWTPRRALAEAQIGGVRLTDLKGCSFSLNGWVTQNGRISAKAGTQIIDIAPTDGHVILELAPSLGERRKAFANELRRLPLGHDPAWGVVPLRLKPRGDPATGKWRSEDDECITIDFSTMIGGKSASRKLQQRADRLDGLAGRLRVRHQALNLEPVFIISNGECIAMGPSLASAKGHW